MFSKISIPIFVAWNVLAQCPIGFINFAQWGESKMEVSKHAYNRICERVHPVHSMKEARKLAKEAYEKGYTLEQLKPEYKYLAQYMTYKLKNESERTEIRIYKECLWLWNGRKRILRTVYPIYKSIPVSMDLKKMRKREKENGCHD